MNLSHLWEDKIIEMNGVYMEYFNLNEDLGVQWINLINSVRGSFFSGSLELCDWLSINKEEFVKGANDLFKKHKINIPPNYGKDCYIESKGLGWELYNFPLEQFLLCVHNCIMIEDNFDVSTLKLIKKELIEPNSRKDIIHACAMSVISIHYLNKGYDLKIPFEISDQKNPDLIINDLNCEVKTILESDWTKEMDLSTGKGKKRKYSENLCYDLGKFIANRGARGIGQSEVLFADLSLTHLGNTIGIALSDKSSLSLSESSSLQEFFNVLDNSLKKLPDPKKDRIIFFTRAKTTCYGFYMDLQPELWNLIKKLEDLGRKSQLGIFPPPNTKKSEKI